MLRSIPNLDVYRPSDAREILGSYIAALNKTDGPTAIILSRSELKLQNNTVVDISKGGYIVKKEKTNLNGIIIATGKELDNSLMAAHNLEAKGLNIRVVSMPNPKLFLKQNSKYINDVLPVNKKIVVVEAASSYGWHQFTSSKNIIAIDEFGKSGSENDVYTDFKFDLKSITDKIEKLLS
jgi:transketolase